MCWKTLLIFSVVQKCGFGQYSDSKSSNNINSYEKLKIEDGYIRGTIQQLAGDGNKTVYAFRGIPYAKPPIGDLRFEPPHRNDKWNNILDATKDKSQCVQSLNPVQGSEDCLHINVYTPKLNGKLPVLVWIYGGGFIRGSATYEEYRPDPILSEEDIIVVSFNYRVGFFGFISTGDLIAPGNAGLKDQCFALKWVQRNIQYFGGDPKKVTIFGESAGAASVSYQLQSNCSKDLFRAAIMQSGNSLALWALNRNASFVAYQTGEALHVDTTNSTTLVEGLKKVPYEKLHEVATVTGIGTIVPNPLAGLFFSPVIEPNHGGAFFSAYSDKILSEGQFHHVPVIIGINSMEGSAVTDVIGYIRFYFGIYDLNYRGLAPADLTSNWLQHDSAAFAVKLNYFGVLPIFLQEAQIIKFISDDQFNRPTRRTVQQLSKYIPVYFYRFSYKGKLGAGVPGSVGVGHGEDLNYFFTYPNETESPQDKLTRHRLVKLWTNFAKHKNPTPRSDPLLENITWRIAGNNPENLTFLDIGYNLQLSVNPFEKDMQFYDKVYKNYGSPPYNTY